MGQSPTPILNRAQKRQLERLAARQKPALVTAKPEPTAAAAKPDEPAKPKVAQIIDGIELDERGDIIFESDEERAHFEGLPPKTLQEQIGDLATRLYATEAELAQTKEILGRRNVALIKSLRRNRELLGQINAAAAPPADPTPESEPAGD